jgi:hypothetical protein
MLTGHLSGRKEYWWKIFDCNALVSSSIQLAETQVYDEEVTLKQ